MEILELEPDTIDLGSFDMPKLKLSQDSDNDGDIEDFVSSKPSVNFGSGIELLMNEKKTNESKKSSSSIEIEDITKLEDELNDLSVKEEVKEDNVKTINQPSNNSETSSKKSIFGNLFNSEKENGSNVKEVTKNLGQSTSNMNESRTWDGYGKFNNVPVNLEKTQEKPQLTKEEELKEKFKYLRKLEDLEKKGVSLSKRYNMDSDLQEMIGEYETIYAERERDNSVKFQGKMLMACITGLEFLNSKFDPFDIKLDGWGEQLNENIDEYDEIFGELHEKYRSKAKMSPELKLLFQLGGSAIMVHMSNTLFKSSMPGMDDIMRQNPELMKQFTNAAVNSMGQTNPGFSGFMNNVFSNSNANANANANVNSQRENNSFNPGFSMPPNVNSGPPPAPMETKLPERSQRSQNVSNRPDLMGARGGVVLDQNEGNPYEEEPRIIRPEMKGPSQSSLNSKQNDINSLLSGLKTKTVNVEQEKEKNEASTISVEDLKELTGAKIPKTKRKQKSDKNIVSLDI